MAVLALTLFAAASCGKPYLNPGERKMVIEGWIAEDEYPVVMLTWNHPITESPIHLDEDFLSRYVITFGAKVVLTDDMGNSVTLTGRRDKRYPSQYVFSSINMKGQRGHSYKLSVKYNSITASAQTTIPDGECSLENIEPVKVEDGNYYIQADVRRSSSDLCAVCFHSPDTKNTYYRMCYLGVCKENVEKASILRSITAAASGYNFHFEPGETAYLRISAMDAASIKYYRDLENVVMGGHNAIFPVTYNIYSNIDGGLGFFCGLNSQYYTVTLPESE